MGIAISSTLIALAIVFMLAFALDVYFKKLAIVLAIVFGIAALLTLFLFNGRHIL